MRTMSFVVAAVAASVLAIPAAAQESADELAKKLSNPVASLISVPFQFNVDFGLGRDGEGESYLLKIQPVIPFSLGENWTLISRTIVPVIDFNHVFEDNVFGLSNIQQSLFLSPAQPGPGGLIWGIGPVISLPTATDPTLGSNKWGAGPTGVALVQRGPWTVGALANHVWTFGGSDGSDPGDLNQTFIQPFISYALPAGQTITLDSEATYDWIVDEWTVPLNLGYSKVFNVGSQAMSFQVGGRYYVVTPDNGPVWGLRSTLTFLFPTAR